MQTSSPTMSNPVSGDGAFAALRDFVNAGRQRKPARRQVRDKGSVPRQEPAETCDLCSLPVPPRHRHLLEMETRDVACACDACALRFHDVTGGRFKLIPRDARFLPDFRMTEAQWASMGVPIDLAFVFVDSVAQKRTALYPSPAGVTESLLSMQAWEEIAAAYPALNDVEEDVEALLINRLGDEPLYLIAPIDACYELAGLIRLHWRGFSGGEEVWKEVDRFFERLQTRTRHA